MIWLYLLFSSALLATPEVHYEFLGLGETKKLKLLGGNILVPKQNIFLIETQGASVTLRAKKPGYAIIKGQNRIYEVSALSIRQTRTYLELSQKLKNIPGIQVTVKKAKVLIEGELTYLNVMKRIEKACLNVTCEFENRLRVPSYFQSDLRGYLYTFMQERGFSGGQLLFEPNWKILWPKQKIKKAEALESLNHFGIESQYSPQTIKIEPGVRVQMLIAEVRRQNMSQFGLNWPTQLSAQVLPDSGLFEPAQLTVNWAEQSGVGKTLASPSLLVKSGGNAEFMAGGEIPIRLVGERVNELQWKRYGILIKLGVTTDLSGRMSLNLECEVSSVDGAITVEGVPGFKTNRVSTQFDLSEPRSLILSGLLKSDQAQALSGLKGLAGLPILGSLFSSRDFRQDQSELIIIVRPELVLPQE